MSGQPPPNGFNPGAFEFRPGQGAPFVPRGQQQQGQGQQGYPGQGQGQGQGYGGYNQYGGQQGGYGGYPQQGGGGGYGGYSQYGGGYPQQQQQQPPQQPQSQAYIPPNARGNFQPQAVRNVQGFQPPNLPPTSSSPKPESTPAGKPVSLSIGGGAPKAAPSLSIGGAAPKAAPSLSIGGGAPKAAPSLSIGGQPKAAPSLSIGGAPKAAPSLSIGGAPKAAPSLSIGGGKKPEEKKEEEKKSEPVEDSTPAPAATTDAQVKVVASTTDAPTPAASSTPAPTSVAASGTSTPSGTNYTKVSAKNDADAILKEQAAAGAEALKDLYGDDVKDTNSKSHLNIIFTGHVDAGKSTMGGQLLFLTGAVDKRTMEKYEQEAKAAGRETWYLSWALDSNKEERAQGKTIEVGRSYFESEKRRYTILDAPGHKTYVPSMITGAAQADVAILVLSARKGEFETGFEREGQTREHAMLIKNNGVNKLIVAVNKMDDPTVQWDKERYDEICKKITPFLKSVGFNPKTDLTFIPVSGQIAQNIKDRIDKKIAPWYEGPSLLEHLDNMEVTDRDIDAPPIIPISEKYAELGTMVMGKIEAGRVKKGHKLLMMPNKTPVDVSAVYSEQGDEMEQAFCGESVRIRLSGISDKDITPGFVLCSPQKPVKTVTAFKADLSIIEAKNIICGGYTCVLHAHTLAEEVTLTSLLAYYERRSRRKSKKPPQFAKQGMLVSVLIETTAPICIETYKDSKILGRFSLRDEGKTVAIGKVTKLIEKPEDLPNVAGLTLAGNAAA